MTTGNFGFLQGHSPLLAELGAVAEKLYPFDPIRCVLKLRQLAGALTQDIAAGLGIQQQQRRTPFNYRRARVYRAIKGMDADSRAALREALLQSIPPANAMADLFFN